MKPEAEEPVSDGGSGTSRAEATEVGGVLDLADRFDRLDAVDDAVSLVSLEREREELVREAACDLGGLAVELEAVLPPSFSFIMLAALRGDGAAEWPSKLLMKLCGGDFEYCDGDLEACDSDLDS